MLTLIISQFVVHKIVCFSCLQSIKFNDFFDDAFKSSDFDVEIIGGLLHPDSTKLILIENVIFSTLSNVDSWHSLITGGGGPRDPLIYSDPTMLAFRHNVIIRYQGTTISAATHLISDRNIQEKLSDSNPFCDHSGLNNVSIVVAMVRAE